MKLGVDLSILDELEPLGAKYFYQGSPIEPFSFFAGHSNIKLVRLRLWHDPFDAEGNPYGGGGNDLACFLRLAKRAAAQGMSIVLDFHYSDFWVDPGRQNPPKAWKNKTYAEIAALLKEYTRKTLISIKNEGIDLYAIQVGNEITNGFLFPHGQLWREDDSSPEDGFMRLAGLLKWAMPPARRLSLRL